MSIDLREERRWRQLTYDLHYTMWGLRILIVLLLALALTI